MASLSCAFPQALREGIIQQQKSRDQAFTPPFCALLKDDKVQAQYLKWADQHAEVIRYQPLLSKISATIKKDRGIKDSCTLLALEAIKHLFSSVSPFQNALDAWLANPTSPRATSNLLYFQFPVASMSQCIETYSEAGLLSEDQMMELIKQAPPRMISALLPHMLKLTDNRFVAWLSQI